MVDPLSYFFPVVWTTDVMHYSNEGKHGSSPSWLGGLVQPGHMILAKPIIVLPWHFKNFILGESLFPVVEKAMDESLDAISSYAPLSFAKAVLKE